MNYLHISEKFYSIQGEGKTMGIPAIFLRLGGCNILCKSDTWVCDTIDVWRNSTKIEYDKVFTKDEILKLETSNVHLVITGGEPMLHQTNLISFLKWFGEQYMFLPTIEIETNGTILPDARLYNMVRYWNVSLKLENSGVPIQKRKISKVVRFLSRQSSKKVIFKYVVTCEDDIKEIISTYPSTTIKDVYLMPAGATQEELAITRPIVAELCKKYMFKFSDRLQVVVWDKATGV